MYIKGTILLGFLFILLGLVGIFNSDLIANNTTVERGIGPLRVLHQETKSIPMAPLLSGTVLLIGVGLVAAGAKRS